VCAADMPLPNLDRCSTEMSLRTHPMADHQPAKTLLHHLARQNPACADCSNPNPQWASGMPAPPPRALLTPAVSFALFLCLQCAGVHRGFGVHIRYLSSTHTSPQRPISPLQLREIRLDGHLAARSAQAHAGALPVHTPLSATHLFAARWKRPFQRLRPVLLPR